MMRKINKTKFVIILLFSTIFVLGGCVGNGNTSSNIENSTETFVESKIYINYPIPDGISYQDDVIVFVDGNEIGKMKCGDKTYFTIDLSVGEHDIHLKRDTKIRKYDTNSVTFEVSELKKEVFITATENSFSGLKLSED